MNTSNTKYQSLEAHTVKIVLSMLGTNLSKNQIVSLYTVKPISELKDLLTIQVLSDNHYNPTTKVSNYFY